MLWHEAKGPLTHCSRGQTSIQLRPMDSDPQALDMPQGEATSPCVPPAPESEGHTLYMERTGKHSEATRIAALAVYAETGNAALSAQSLGLPRQTVDGWVNDERAPQLLDDLRATLRYDTGFKLASLSKLALSKVERALEDGDAVVLKDGRVIYKPQSGRDATIIASILIDKWQLISGAMVQNNALLSSVDAMSKQLAAIGEQLAANAPPPPPEPPPPDSPDSGLGGGENLIG